MNSKCEKIIWNQLRDRRLSNLKFRRQHPINKYIVDFYCHEKNLIIELDGPPHEITENRLKDEIREKELLRLGYKILRFKETEVFNNLGKVLNRIVDYTK